MNESHVGKRIGDYEIVRFLGKGGMGAVFEGRDVPRERRVAIKVPHEAALADEDYVRRFVEEGRTAQSVRHPNVVQTYAVNADPREPFIAMEYVEGRPLLMVIRREVKLDPERALRIAAQAASALGAIHRANIVHRDIKPSNIMLSEGDKAKIMDFGIARVRRSPKDAAVSSDEWIGTSFYLSPEQAENAAIDPRSDIYSLGVVLFEMLGGRVPFRSDDPAELLRMIREEPVPEIGRLNPRVPESVQIVLDMAMAKDPSDRYSNAGEMFEELIEAVKEVSGKK